LERGEAGEKRKGIECNELGKLPWKKRKWELKKWDREKNRLKIKLERKSRTKLVIWGNEGIPSQRRGEKKKEKKKKNGMGAFV